MSATTTFANCVLFLSHSCFNSIAFDSFYVYALKDPRRDPAQPFYIGKGTGTRSYDHLVRPDDSRKGRRIHEIRGAGLR